jgi:hypothetical protein
MTGRNPDGIEDFPPPDCSDVAYCPQQLNAIIGAYEAFRFGGDLAGPLPVGAVQAGRIGVAAAVGAALPAGEVQHLRRAGDATHIRYLRPDSS